MNNKGSVMYYVYSILVVAIIVFAFIFLGFLIYDLILKLSVQDFTNNTVIQALITLIITVFIGGYFNKHLEHRNHKKIELFKIKLNISLNLVNLASSYYYFPSDEQVRNALINESKKIKLYFDDDVLRALNLYLENINQKPELYDELINKLKKHVN